jgi:uracil-DNA glycosylase family 4
MTERRRMTGRWLVANSLPSSRMNEGAPLSYDPDCTACPRLAGFLAEARARFPNYWCRPVASVGPVNAKLLIIGLAPGFHGANRTGRPFTGDHAGILLYETLHELGFSNKPNSVAADDGLRLIDARISNAAKCVPPQNKPLPEEVKRCNAYLQTELRELKRLRVIVALGRIAHDAVLLAHGLKGGKFPFAHGAEHVLNETLVMLDSYHCSRYNTQTRRLTAEMFKAVLKRARSLAL